MLEYLRVEKISSRTKWDICEKPKAFMHLIPTIVYVFIRGLPKINVQNWLKSNTSKKTQNLLLMIIMHDSVILRQSNSIILCIPWKYDYQKGQICMHVVCT